MCRCRTNQNQDRGCVSTTRRCPDQGSESNSLVKTMKCLFIIFYGFSGLIKAASASQKDDLSAKSHIVSDEQLAAGSVLPSDGQIERSDLIYKPQSIRDAASWSRLTYLQDLYDACYDLDVDKVSNLVHQMDNFDSFPFEEAIKLVIEASPEGNNDEFRRWSIINLLCDVAKYSDTAVKIITTNFSSNAKLMKYFNTAYVERDLFDESLQELAKNFNNLKDVPWSSLSEALRNIESLDEINQTFPELLTSTSPAIQDFLIASDIPEISQKALMNAVESILPMAEECIKNSKFSLRVHYIISDLLKSPHAEIWEFTRDLSATKKDILEKTIFWMAARSDQLLMAFKTSSLEMTKYVYETIERLPSDVTKSLLQCLYGNFDQIASLNKDHRVFYFLYEKLYEKPQPSNNMEPIRHDSDQTSKLPETPTKSLIRLMQSYLNQITALSREPHELYLRISLTKEKRQDILQHVFNGVFDQDPILCALFKSRWGLAAKFLRLLEEQENTISLEDSLPHWFFRRLLALPWPVYQKMRQHYTIRTVNRVEISFIFDTIISSPNVDRRVVVDLLGHPSIDYKDFSKYCSMLTMKFVDAIYACITYQLDGWLLETLDTYRCILENKKLLNRIDKKYETYNAMNRFQSFLLFFKNFILEPSIDAHKAISKEANPDFPSDAVKKLQVSFEELEYDWDYRAIGNKLKQKIEWMLQYIVPEITRPFHPEIDTVIFREASKTFLFYLFQENSFFVLERLAGIKSF